MWNGQARVPLTIGNGVLQNNRLPLSRGMETQCGASRQEECLAQF